jgi:hypothetical protein
MGTMRLHCKVNVIRCILRNYSGKNGLKVACGPRIDAQGGNRSLYCAVPPGSNQRCCMAMTSGSFMRVSKNMPDLNPCRMPKSFNDISFTLNNQQEIKGIEVEGDR